jgi:hypothetical protein
MMHLGMSTLDKEEDCDLGSEFFSLACFKPQSFLSLYSVYQEKKEHKKSGAQMTQSVRCQKKQTIIISAQKVRRQEFLINQHFSKNKGIYDFIIKSIAKPCSYQFHFITTKV